MCMCEYRYPLAAVSSVMIILITYRANNNIIVNRLITLSGSDRILVKLYFVIPDSSSSLHVIANQILGKRVHSITYSVTLITDRQFLESNKNTI